LPQQSPVSPTNVKSSSGPSADARSSAAVARAISASTCALLCSASARASPRTMKSQPAARGAAAHHQKPRCQSEGTPHPQSGVSGWSAGGVTS
jgi:hypothetical protein